MAGSCFSIQPLWFQTDACFEAAGAYFSGDWVYLHFGMESPVLSELHTNHKEALAVVVAAKR